jgi:hypothetical protein
MAKKMVDFRRKRISGKVARKRM